MTTHGIDSGHAATSPSERRPNVYLTSQIGASFRTRLLKQLGNRMVRAGQVIVEAESIYADQVMQRDTFVEGTDPWKDIDRVAKRILERKRKIETTIRITGPSMQKALLGNVDEQNGPLYRALCRDTFRVSPNIAHADLSRAIKPSIEAGPEDEYQTIKARLFRALGIVSDAETVEA